MTHPGGDKDELGRNQYRLRIPMGTTGISSVGILDHGNGGPPSCSALRSCNAVTPSPVVIRSSPSSRRTSPPLVSPAAP